MKFTDANARQWLLDAGIELCSDELFEEGGLLIWWSKSYSPLIDVRKFKSIVKSSLYWEDIDIEEAILKIKGLNAFT